MFFSIFWKLHQILNSKTWYEKYLSSRTCIIYKGGVGSKKKNSLWIQNNELFLYTNTKKFQLVTKLTFETLDPQIKQALNLVSVILAHVSISSDAFWTMHWLEGSSLPGEMHIVMISMFWLYLLK